MKVTSTSTHQETRYDRHHLIDWWDQKRLKNTSILVAGAGALGNEVLKNLALLGIGHLTLIDFDTISITNLTRSVLFRESDLGLPKVEVARQKLLEINPEISVTAIHGNLEFDLGVGEIRQHDLIIGCLDSIHARWLINQLAYRAGVPWINGGIGVSEGEVSFFNPNTEAACYECSLSPKMWERRNQRFSCQGLKKELPENTIPTTATIASTVAAIQVQQALLYLHNNFDLLQAGEKIYLGLNPWTTFKVKINRKEECLAHDLTIPPTINVKYDPHLTVETLLEKLEASGFTEIVLWLRNELIGTMQCLNPNCGYEEIINRPISQYPESKLPCPKCHETRDFEKIQNFSREDTNLHFPLQTLNLPKNEILHCETQQGYIAVQFYHQ